MFFERLPVDLIAEILGELDLESLIQMAYVSKRFYSVASDPSLNPWRRPIMRILNMHMYEPALKHLSVRLIVPRRNWIEIITLARPSFVLYDATLPNLKSEEWEECFKRRFLPSWQKWKKESSWKEAFLKLLHRVWHRSVSSCTSDEAWTKYVVLNRNGSANELEVSSRNYNPFSVFNEMKQQNNLSHLETRIRASYRLVVELSDVRILAFGTLAKPRSDLMVNPNAHMFLTPPGITANRPGNVLTKLASRNRLGFVDDHGVYPMSPSTVPAYLFKDYHNPVVTYKRLIYPQPATTHANYPLFTSGGGDSRWNDLDEIEESGLHWVGALMQAMVSHPRLLKSHNLFFCCRITAQLICPSRDSDNPRHQYASFAWDDLWAIAPWMDEIITKRINGAGLGN
uniref:F-box domain-containing protein n=1 Tax=Psilocybe cubensis TaxID=181762 RepID=A0A8H7XXZ0_PSICU